MRCASRAAAVTPDRVFHQPAGSPLTNRVAGRLVKNDETQGARILRNEAYNPYAAMTKDEAQHGGSRVSPAC